MGRAHGASRTGGQTFADVAGTTYLDGRSTEKVDLEASWTEPIDDPREVGPREIDARTAVFSLPMDASAVVPDDQLAAYRLRDGKELSFGSQLDPRAEPTRCRRRTTSATPGTAG